MMSKRTQFNIAGHKFLIRSSLVLFTIIAVGFNGATTDDVADTNSASTTLEPGKWI